MCPLPSSERQLLLEIARRSLIHAVTNPSPGEVLAAVDTSFLSSGVFVTLHRRGRLRGCIGQMGDPQPVHSLVSYCARAAALEDPRFRPVEWHEIPEIGIELSILSATEELRPERIEVGKHGLMVTRGRNRGVLLPQVAIQYRWNAERFLDETCLKAGLEPSAWKAAETRIEAFTAEVFSESELCTDVSAVSLPPSG